MCILWNIGQGKNKIWAIKILYPDQQYKVSISLYNADY